MFHGNMAHTGSSPFNTRGDKGKLKWEFPANSNGKFPGTAHPLSSPALGADGTIYISSWNGLLAISPHGISKWIFRSKASGESSSPAIGRDGTIYFASTDGSLYAMNPNGAVQWKFPSRGVASSPTLGADRTIYFASFDGNLYAVNANGTQKWRFRTGDKVPMIPTLASDGTIYFSGGALNPNGSLKWMFPSRMASFPKFSPPAVAADGTIYLGSCDGDLHALNPDGTSRWDFPVERGYVFSTPAIGRDGTIYFGVNGGSYFYALSPDGTLKWKFKTGGNVLSSAAIGADGTIYFGSEDGHFYALNPDGTQRWKYPPRERHEIRSARHHRAHARGKATSRAMQYEVSTEFRQINAASVSSPAIGADGTVYFASLDGHLYALH
jgi:outer membrane protein assembly factor BamB